MLFKNRRQNTCASWGGNWANAFRNLAANSCCYACCTGPGLALWIATQSASSVLGSGWCKRCRSRSIALAVASQAKSAEKFRTRCRRENCRAETNVSWKQSAASAWLPSNLYAVCQISGPCFLTIPCQSITCKRISFWSYLLSGQRCINKIKTVVSPAYFITKNKARFNGFAKNGVIGNSSKLRGVR